MEKHKIDWLNLPGYKGETFNPIVGCTKVSPACKNCYAEKMARRISGIAIAKYNDEDFDLSGIGNYAEVILNGKWNGQTRFVPNAINKPLHWKKSRMIFVCSMSDLFHETVDYDWIDRVMKVAEECPEHIFVFLTKRPFAMKGYFDVQTEYENYIPLKNVWLGVTAENQKEADKRIPILLDIPAAKRFVSIEPMLGKIDLNLINEGIGLDIDCLNGTCKSMNETYHDGPKLDWVICGGESGHNARPMHPDWVRSIRDQCKEVGTPFFFKQWGHWIPEDLWPEDICLDMNKTMYAHDHNENYFPIGTKKSGSQLDGQHHKEFPV